MKIELKPLLGKMNHECRSALESAIHFSIAKKKNSVELEFWLIKLLESKKSAICTILHYYNINEIELVQLLYSPSHELTDNNADVPSLSRELVDIIQKSWLLASVEFNSAYINSGHLFYVMLVEIMPLGLSSKLRKLLSKINPEELKDKFLEIIKTSDEARQIDLSQATPIGYSNTLTRFTTDLVDLARKKSLDRAVGRENELHQLIDILCRRKQNNPLLVGEAGVGKTAIVEELAYRLAEDSVPHMLKGATLRSLDLASLQAGANVKGEFEQRLKNIINEIKKSSTKVILFIDEIHNIIGTGSGTAQNDMANLLKPELARGELLLIGATTWGEYKKFFEKDAALKRRFQLIKVREQSEQESICILRNVAELLEQYHGVKITEKAVQQAVKLSSKYITDKHLPDKAISLLDSACTRVKLSQTILPIELQQMQQERILLMQHIKRLKTEIHNDSSDLQEKLLDKQARLEEQYKLNYNNWQQKSTIVQDLKELNTVNSKELYLSKRTELSNLASNPTIHEQVDEKVIASIISAWTAIPLPTEDTIKNEVDSLLNLETNISKRVVGQDYAVKQIVQNIRMAKASISDPRKPIGVFLLLGESGVGKTETALSIAETIYGHENKMITINMSEYKEPHKISSLIGSPPGYVGYGEGGKLTEQVRKNPYSVVLLDEMEKAHSDVQELFLQVFDKGTLTDSEGIEVNFKNTIILMTSNACAHKLSEFCHNNKKVDIDKLTTYLNEQLLQVFKPEFLGRLKVIPYLPLDNKILEEITKLQFTKIANRIKEHYQAEFTHTQEVIQKIVNESTASKIGARAIEHIITSNILPDLSVQLLESVLTNEKPQVVSLEVKADKFICSFVSK